MLPFATLLHHTTCECVAAVSVSHSETTAAAENNVTVVGGTGAVDSSVEIATETIETTPYSCTIKMS